jgi:hypothetical protein
MTNPERDLSSKSIAQQVISVHFEHHHPAASASVHLEKRPLLCQLSQPLEESLPGERRQLRTN